jgi:hypothetical protein
MCRADSYGWSRCPSSRCREFIQSDPLMWSTLPALLARRRTVPPPHMSPQVHAERIDAAATRSVGFGRSVNKFLFLHHTVSAVEVPRSIQSPGRSPVVDGDVAPTLASQIHLLALRSNATQDGPYVYASASARVIVLVPTGRPGDGSVDGQIQSATAQIRSPPIHRSSPSSGD